MKKIITFLLGIVAFGGHAQAPAPAGRPDSTIQLKVLRQGRYSSAVYTINHEPVTPATVKALLRRYPSAAAELHKGRTQTWLGLGLLPVAAVALLVGGQQADRHKDEGGSAFSRAPVPFSILLGALFGYTYVELSNAHFAKAIEAYNRQFH